ncbi:hypothetical protein F7734_10135 [Scytonema sp. UIC 10036]|nr:hypothetical protein [Scytonema sp. UIC 10036]MUG92790.1 hypothetical protein [Scytonema sp. UIC 10036]
MYYKRNLNVSAIALYQKGVQKTLHKGCYAGIKLANIYWIKVTALLH